MEAFHGDSCSAFSFSTFLSFELSVGVQKLLGWPFRLRHVCYLNQGYEYVCVYIGKVPQAFNAMAYLLPAQYQQGQG